MKHFPRKALSLVLALSLLCALMLPAAASEVLGEDLTARTILLDRETELSANVLWTGSDFRAEHLVTYRPNGDVRPVVVCGETLSARRTLSAAAQDLEQQGYRVAAGINGDFYDTGSGVPVGIVVTEGELRTSDGGCYAIGFREDGSALLGRPNVSLSLDLGPGPDGESRVYPLAALNKGRSSTGGIHLYTYDFNSHHTTGTTQPGVDVICTVLEGRLALGEAVTLQAEEVREATSATELQPGQMVLSVNLQSGEQAVEALRSVAPGSVLTVAASAGEGWEEVRYALGALYALVEDGQAVSNDSVSSGLKNANPRTAVGLREDGTVLLYTIDGRRPGHSVGATLDQLSRRMLELGCVDALCLDGGGSTTLTATRPDSREAKRENVPSDGGERSVSDHLLLVSDSEATGELDHFYVDTDAQYVLAGSSVQISVTGVDTAFRPMDSRYDLEASDGELEGDVLITPARGGEIRIEATRGRRSGEAMVYAVREPDSVTVRNVSGGAVSSLSVAPGSVTKLTAAATYRHLPLKADPASFTWTVEGEIGDIDGTGAFTARQSGEGRIVVSAGGQSASIDVSVSGDTSKTVEDFEGETTIFRGLGSHMDYSLTREGGYVRMGRSAGKLDYDLTESEDGTAQWLVRNAGEDITSGGWFDTLDLWVLGDGSGSVLSLLYTDGERERLEWEIGALDFTGWHRFTLAAPGPHVGLQGLQIRGQGSGTIAIDHLTAIHGGAADETPPEIELTPEFAVLTAQIRDGGDLLPQDRISVTWDGAPQTFTYDERTGALSTSMVSDGGPHRITVTARDASGNIGRASYDVPTSADWVPHFPDVPHGHWAASYADFMYTSGIATGYNDGTFRPDLKVTRAQFAVMLFNALRLDGTRYAEAVLPFADVEGLSETALTAVKALYTEGVIGGFVGEDGKHYFRPEDGLSRAQACAMIGRTQEKGWAAPELAFTDGAEIPGYATYYVQTMVSQGILGGYGDGTFRPNGGLTRAQLAKILYSMM